MQNIRRAITDDMWRVAEIEITNYRLNFYPVFKCDEFYFGELNVKNTAEKLINNADAVNNTFVYDDGTVKGFVRINGSEIEKLFVEPVLQGHHIGEKLLRFAISDMNADWLWVLGKNGGAIRFYERNGFTLTDEKKPEEDTDEYLYKMIFNRKESL